MDESADKEIVKDLVKRHVDQLSEHFDCVHIFVCRHQPEKDLPPLTFNAGSGNIYGRFGLIYQWVISMEENIRVGAWENRERKP